MIFLLLLLAIPSFSVVEPIYSGTFTRIKCPAPGMSFTEGLPVRVLADGIDINGWASPEGQMEAQEVRFYVDGILTVTEGSTRGYNHFEGILTNLATGTHVLTTESSNYGGVIKKSPFPVTILVESGPEKSSIVNLTSDLVLSGNTHLDWQNIRLNGNGFRVTSNSGWTGNVIIKNSLITGLAVTELNVPNITNAANPGIDVTTSGNVIIESSTFEWNGASYFRINGQGNVSVRHNEFRASAYIPFVPSDPERSPVLKFQGSSTGTKLFQANKIGAGYLYIIGMSGWVIGGDVDSLSNILIGPRINIRVDNSTHIRIQGNYSRHDYYGGWSQGFNFYFSNNTNPFLCEHNVIRQGSWPVQSVSGIFRYNLIVACGHEWLRTAISGTEIYRNIFISPEPTGNSNAGLWLYGNQTGIQIYNNTLDGGGPGMAFYSPAISVSNGSQVSSLRNNIFTGFIPSASTGIVDRYYTESDSNGRVQYSDYNCFYNPDAEEADNYGTKIVTSIPEASPGFGGNDLDGLNGQVKPEFTQGITIPYQIEEDKVWKREVLVSQVLASFRASYTPKAGSKLIDAGDPMDGSGVDIGAVEAPTGIQVGNDLFGKFGNGANADNEDLSGRWQNGDLAGIVVTPNPFKTDLSVHFKTGILQDSYSNMKLSIFTSSGRLILTLKPIANKIILNGSGLPSGVYVLQVKVGGQLFAKRIVLLK